MAIFAPLILAAWSIRSHWHDRIVRYWTAIGIVFFVWALGPHLRVFGYTTGMILPEPLVRFIPIAANARVPGRAMVVVSLAIAVLGAIAISRSRESSRRRWIGVGAMAVQLVAPIKQAYSLEMVYAFLAAVVFLLVSSIAALMVASRKIPAVRN